MNRRPDSELLPYLASKSELMKKLTGYTVETWDKGNIVAFYDTDSSVGLFQKSDMICAYDEAGNPMIITERLSRKNCSFMYWHKTKRMLHSKVEHMKTELGYDMCVTFGHGYVDYV